MRRYGLQALCTLYFAYLCFQRRSDDSFVICFRSTDRCAIGCDLRLIESPAFAELFGRRNAESSLLRHEKRNERARRTRRKPAAEYSSSTRYEQSRRRDFGQSGFDERTSSLRAWRAFATRWLACSRLQSRSFTRNHDDSRNARGSGLSRQLRRRQICLRCSQGFAVFQYSCASRKIGSPGAR